MRTLLLASNGQTAVTLIQQLHPKGRDVRIAWLTDAKLGVQPEGSHYLERRLEQFAESGLDYTEYLLTEMEQSEIENQLAQYDVVYFEGGNTFRLLKSIQETSIKQVLGRLLDSGVWYLGSSAGTYVACPTIEMATWSHSKKWDRCGVTDLKSLHVVPFLITVHYTPDNKQSVQDGQAQTEYQVRILQDGQALLVQDDHVQLVGEGQEILL